jgi:hypothetical protein
MIWRNIMSRKIKDMDGMVFGDLTVVRQDGKTNAGKTKYLCECNCGRENCKKLISVDGRDLTKGNTKSCGARKYENIEHKKLYAVWQYMITRCYNEQCKDYANYGGRGITVCDLWKDDYFEFESWALENGYKEGLTLDRENVDGNYYPFNCRWITHREQARNKRNNIHIVWNGHDRLLIEVVEELEANYQSSLYHYKKGDLDTYFNKFIKEKEIASIGVLQPQINVLNTLASL